MDMTYDNAQHVERIAAQVLQPRKFRSSSDVEILILSHSSNLLYEDMSILIDQSLIFVDVDKDSRQIVRLLPIFESIQRP